MSRQLAKPLDLPWQTFEEMLTATFAEAPGSSPDSDAWTEAQEKGGWWGTPPAAAAAPPAPIAPSPSSLAWAEPQFDGDAQQYPLHLLPYVSSAFLDGSLAHLPWLQEMPDPMTSAMWSSWVEINPATAAKLGIGDGDIVDVASAHGSVRTAAVALARHRARHRGDAGRPGTSHVHALRERPRREPGRRAGADDGRTRGHLAWAATRVKVSRVERAGRTTDSVRGRHAESTRNMTR